MSPSAVTSARSLRPRWLTPDRRFAVAKRIAKAALVSGVGVFPVRGRTNKGTERAGSFILVELPPSDLPRHFVEALLGGNLLLRFRWVPPASDPIGQLHGRKIDRRLGVSNLAWASVPE